MGLGASSKIQVTFSHPSLLYFIDEQVTGNISFQNTQDELILKAVFLECNGELVYQKESNFHGSPSGRHVKFLNFRIPIVQPSHGQVET